MMDRQILGELIGSLFHWSNPMAVRVHFALNALTFIASYVFGFVLNNIDQFAAITAVVILDALFGFVVALTKGTFETRKALKFVWKFAGYTSLLAALLIVEAGFKGAFWLSETIIVPILLFQVVSILKNMSLAGIIPGELLKKILLKVDKYKEIDKEE